MNTAPPHQKMNPYANYSELDWHKLSSNVTLDVLEKHFDKPWEWDVISANSNITMEFVEKHNDYPWSWYQLSMNPNIHWGVKDTKKQWYTEKERIHAITTLTKHCERFNFTIWNGNFHYFMHKCKEDWHVFDNICWKDTLKYALGSEHYRRLNIGKTFKQRGIYTFIVGGLSFDVTETTDDGIMLLNVDGEKIYCYYDIDMGGCPSCGLGMEIGKPQEVSLYLSEDINGLIMYCMKDTKRERAIKNFN